MGEEKEKTKTKRVEKNSEAGEISDGGGKKDDDGGGGGGIATILLKLDLHCEGCAKKVRRCVRRFEGVEDVMADSSTGKLTVKGNVDPLWLREKVEIKTKNKVALLSAQPKKVVAGASTGDGGEEKKSSEKVENSKVEEKKVEDKKPKKVHCNREVVGLHCDGSAQNIKRFIIKKLKPYLKYKSKRNVAVVPPKKDDGSGGRSHNKKKKEVIAHGGGGDGDGSRKKKGGGGGGDGDGSRKKKDDESTRAEASKSTEPKEQKTEMINNRMEYNYGGYTNPSMYYAMPPMYNQNYSNQDYGVTMNDHGYYGHNTGYIPAMYDHGYGDSTGYVPPPYAGPQYFSDENPNACSVM